MIYIFANKVYIMGASISKRKLIDLRGPVFDSLSLEAKSRGVSLKKYIESVLEEEALRHRVEVVPGVHDPGILSLVGAAKNLVASPDPEDDRLQYILSK